MGLFDKFFQKKINQGVKGYFEMLNGYSPVFYNFHGSLYESELVRMSIDARSRHISKLKVEFKNGAKSQTEKAFITRPNSWQTWSQFLYQLNTILDMQNSAIIIPILNDYGETIGICTTIPEEISVVDNNGTAWLKMRFGNNKTGAIELFRCGIMTKFQYKSDYFGEDNKALKSTMDLIKIQQQGITEAVKKSASFDFMATVNNFAIDDDLAKERDRFTESNLKKGKGLLLFPSSFRDIKQIDYKPYKADPEESKIIQANVFTYFGVNEEVLQNKCTGDSWNAFYEGAIEPFALQFSEILTTMLYGLNYDDEKVGILATANRLQYMTTKDKLEVSAQMADRGILNRDEVREIWNLPPLPNGQGKTYVIRGEYYDAKQKLKEGEQK